MRLQSSALMDPNSKFATIGRGMVVLLSRVANLVYCSHAAGIASVAVSIFLYFSKKVIILHWMKVVTLRKTIESIDVFGDSGQIRHRVILVEKFVVSLFSSGFAIHPVSIQKGRLGTLPVDIWHICIFSVRGWHFVHPYIDLRHTDWWKYQTYWLSWWILTARCYIYFFGYWTLEN